MEFIVPIAYTSGVSTNATHDVFELGSPTNDAVVLLGFELAQTSEIGDAQEQQLELLLKAVTGAPTSGSGGTAAATARPRDTSRASTYAGTFENGNTTKLTGGTSLELARFAWNVRMPLPYWPIPEERVTIGGGEHLVLEMVSTPSGSIAKAVGRVAFDVSTGG
jgi:hypothetical protein